MTQTSPATVPEPAPQPTAARLWTAHDVAEYLGIPPDHPVPVALPRHRPGRLPGRPASALRARCRPGLAAAARQLMAGNIQGHRVLSLALSAAVKELAVAARGRMIMERILFTVRETAEMLGVSRSRVYELISTEQLASIKIGRSRRVSLASIRRFVEKAAA